MKKRDGAFVVLFRDKMKKEVFLVYRSDWPIWNGVGGGVEDGEDPNDAAMREVEEETGFTVKIGRKLGIYEDYHPHTKEQVNNVHLFEGWYVSGAYKPEFPGCKGAWFSVHKLPRDITDKTRQRVADALTTTDIPFRKKTYRSQLKNNLHLLLRHPVAAYRYFHRK